MEYRPLDVTVISADGLKDVNLISKMDVYVVVSIADDPTTKRKTHVDKDGGKSPKWNDHLKFNVDARNPNVPLVFRIRSDRPLGDKDIGVVTVPIKELLDHPTAYGGGERVVEYQVRTPSGKSKGTLKFSYKFGDKVAAPAAPPPPQQKAAPEKFKHSDEPVTAYPAQAGASTAYAAYAPPQQGYGYPPPQQHIGYPPAAAYGYPPPPQQGYGYPPQQHGYGYPPPPQGGYGYPPQVVVQPQQVKKKKNNFGLGLGAGLLGGLLVGDMISDVGEMGAYDAGYDAGFDDAGFDF